jgi:hypothetical protein
MECSRTLVGGDADREGNLRVSSFTIIFPRALKSGLIAGLEKPDLQRAARILGFFVFALPRNLSFMPPYE